MNDPNLIQLEHGVLFIGDIDETVHDDDDTIVSMCGPGDSHEETLNSEDARSLIKWLDKDYQ